MVLYFKRAGHCTRCAQPFGDRTTAYMVAEIWRARESAGAAVMRREITLVCAGCVTPGEAAEATVASVCEGCGQLMLSPVAVATCSDRGAQRERRARRRRARRQFCPVCYEAFLARRAAQYCSNACRQRGYRRRKAAKAATIRKAIDLAARLIG
jgi:hypothetical protein